MYLVVDKPLADTFHVSTAFSRCSKTAEHKHYRGADNAD